MKRLLALLLALALLWTGAALAEVLVDEDYALTDDLEVEYGYDYSSPEEVALYLYAFIQLPPNYITKTEAREMGWGSKSGNLWLVAEGYSIGGDVFSNREALLPKKKGRVWYECDVNYQGGYRGAERIVFSNDGLIYYTANHYQDFELLYDGWYYEGVLYEDQFYEEVG